MATVTFKNRSSSDYRFTCESLNDPIISELKEMIAFTNTFVHRRNSYHPTLAKLPTRGLRIRPRGPRAGATHDTPIENATRFDVYIREYKKSA
tara:strand:- start:331 stop:609 length:279 start_codon:yes stop_codon:yes gene_type:complete